MWVLLLTFPLQKHMPQRVCALGDVGISCSLVCLSLSSFLHEHLTVLNVILVVRGKFFTQSIP